MGGGYYRHISSNPKDRAWASALDTCDRKIEQAKSFKDKQRARDTLYEEFENIFGKDKKDKKGK